MRGQRRGEHAAAPGSSGAAPAGARGLKVDSGGEAGMMPRVKTLSIVRRLTAGLAACGALAMAAERPNVVLIMVDDFGFECVGANGCTDYATPNIDRLAAEGIRFQHCYVQPLCTPTRVQLMTGQYNVRNYVRFGLLERAQTTFAHLFKQAGYATGITGKWQLGRELDSPRHFGFDESCLWQHTRRPPRYANPGLEYNGVERDFATGEYGPQLVNDFAVDFIARHRDEPFLLYYPMILTHAPFQPTPDSPDWDPSARGEGVNRDPKHFAAMVAWTDRMVGRVVGALEKHGLRERTLVLFLGDNGTLGQITTMMGQQPVKGGKGSSTRAGMQVPLIANWPGAIAAGQVCGDLIDSTDFLPTICEAAGVSVPVGLLLDGRSFAPQLRGERGQPRDWMYCWYARNGGAQATHEFAATQRFKLYRDGRFYDYGGDTGETTPLIADQLDPGANAVRQQLTTVLERFRAVRPAAIAAGAENVEE